MLDAQEHVSVGDNVIDTGGGGPLMLQLLWGTDVA